MTRGAAVFLLALMAASGCESTSPKTPLVTAAMVKSGARQHADKATLRSGRSLFVNRCTRCHALPAVDAKSTKDWPQVVAEMSKRSGLNSEQRNAVLAYILTAQAAPAE